MNDNELVVEREMFSLYGQSICCMVLRVSIMQGIQCISESFLK